MPWSFGCNKRLTSKFDLLEIVNAILYRLKSGCQWRLLPPGHFFSGSLRPGTPQEMVLEG